MSLERRTRKTPSVLCHAEDNSQKEEEGRWRQRAFSIRGGRTLMMEGVTLRGVHQIAPEPSRNKRLSTGRDGLLIPMDSGQRRSIIKQILGTENVAKVQNLILVKMEPSTRAAWPLVREGRKGSEE